MALKTAIKAGVEWAKNFGIPDEPPETLGPQFHNFTGGPEEARAGYRATMGWTQHEEPKSQGQLFDPESIPRQEPHQQTPEQFARDPRTWWHGRVTRGGPTSSLGGSTVGQGEGFHAGTQAAARQRVSANIRRRSLKPGMAGHLYPLRITGPVEGPENVKEDVTKHYELGPVQHRWGQQVGGRQTGYLYEQAAEDPGSISVGVPRRKGFLATQREMVRSAMQGGQYVHPNIQWATVKQPEHTPEEIGDLPYRRPTPEGQRHAQPSLTPENWSEPGSYLWPSSESTPRASYVTESGKKKHVWAKASGLPGSALLGKQWQPT